MSKRFCMLSLPFTVDVVAEDGKVSARNPSTTVDDWESSGGMVSLSDFRDSAGRSICDVLTDRHGARLAEMAAREISITI